MMRTFFGRVEHAGGSRRPQASPIIARDVWTTRILSLLDAVDLREAPHVECAGRTRFDRARQREHRTTWTTTEASATLTRSLGGHRV